MLLYYPAVTKNLISYALPKHFYVQITFGVSSKLLLAQLISATGGENLRFMFIVLHRKIERSYNYCTYGLLSRIKSACNFFMQQLMLRKLKNTLESKEHLYSFMLFKMSKLLNIRLEISVGTCFQVLLMFCNKYNAGVGLSTA